MQRVSAHMLIKNFDNIYQKLSIWTKGPNNSREIKFPDFEINCESVTSKPDENMYVNIIYTIRGAATFIFSNELKDILDSKPKLPSALKLKNGHRLGMPEIAPGETHELFFLYSVCLFFKCHKPF